MQRKYNPAHFILGSVIALGLTSLMVAGDAHAQIAFVSDREGNEDIYVMDTDGTNQRKLTNHPEDEDDPSWSPDGKQIAFERDWEIYVMDTDGGNLQNLTNNPAEDFHTSWSPGGKRIAFVSDRDGNPEIYVMDTDGQNPQRLTDNPADDHSPSWSPDGKRIAFVSERDEHPHKVQGQFAGEIYVMDTDGGNLQNLTNNPAEDDGPSWSPDGKQIAFASDREDNLGWDIFVMNANGSNPRNLTKGHGWADLDPSWSPDGKRIAFASFGRNGRKMDIYVMEADGQNPRQLTNNPLAFDYEPVWYRPVFAVAPADKQLTMWGWLKQVTR